MNFQPIRLFPIIAVLMLVFCEASEAQRSAATTDQPLPASNATTEMPQVIRDGLIELRLESSSLTAAVAEPIELRLVVEAPEKTQVAMPVVGASLGKFSVIDSQSINALPMDGDPARRRWEYQLTIESIESGELIIPAMEIVCRLPQDPPTQSAQQSIRSKPFLIHVASLLSEDQDPKAFRGIKTSLETAEMESPESTNRWIVAGSVLVALALLSGFFWWRRDRQPTPFQWANEEIDAIDALSANQSISTGDAYAELSKVLSVFLEQELGFPATAMSSTELKAEMVSRNHSAPTIARLTQFFSEADEVKFSGRPRPHVSLTDSPATSVREIIGQIRQTSLDRDRGE